MALTNIPLSGSPKDIIVSFLIEISKLNNILDCYVVFAMKNLSSEITYWETLKSFRMQYEIALRLQPQENPLRTPCAHIIFSDSLDLLK